MALMTRQQSTVSQADLDLITHASHWNPFTILGPHPVSAKEGSKGWTIRAFLPEARRAWVVDLSRGEPGKLVPMERIARRRLLRGRLPGPHPSRSRTGCKIENHEGHSWEFVDPYRVRPGAHRLRPAPARRRDPLHNYERLGAHLRTHRRVPRRPLRRLGARTPSGSASSATSTTGTAAATRCGTAGRPGSGRSSSPTSARARSTSSRSRAATTTTSSRRPTPTASAPSMRPKTASIVWDIQALEWDDEEWMANRRRAPGARPADLGLRGPSRLLEAQAPRTATAA